MDRLNDVLNCIDSLRKQTFSPYEIILILDPDLKLEFYASRVPSYVNVAISNERGLSNARNAGVRRASGDIVAFIDDDAIADIDWLRNLVKNYEYPSVFGVGGFVKPVWENERPMWFPEELDWIVGCSYKGLPEHRFVVRNPIGCNMSFFKDIFDKTGYFNANIGRFRRKLLGSEETEFSVRLLKIFQSRRLFMNLRLLFITGFPEQG